MKHTHQRASRSSNSAQVAPSPSSERRDRRSFHTMSVLRESTDRRTHNVPTSTYSSLYFISPTLHLSHFSSPSLFISSHSSSPPSFILSALPYISLPPTPAPPDDVTPRATTGSTSQLAKKNTSCDLDALHYLQRPTALSNIQKNIIQIVTQGNSYTNTENSELFVGTNT